MDKNEMKRLLEAVKSGETAIDTAMEELIDLPYKDLGFAKIDNHRELRVGYPEVIYCAGKTVDQVREIVAFMLTKNSNILATRASEEMYLAVKELCADAQYNALGRVITIPKK